MQSIGMYALLKNQGIIISLTPIQLASFIATMIAGTMFLVWLGELVTARGIGNGISLLIFSGIVGRIPIVFGQTTTTISSDNIFNMISFLVMGIFVIASIVLINEATRQIPVHYARRVRGNKTTGGDTTHLPLRLNQAGVIPIIFAVSLVLVPSLLGNFLSQLKQPWIKSIALGMSNLFNPDSIFYNVVYFTLVVAFTFFYTAIIFNTKKISEEMQQHGGFIPGVRPGTSTAKYLNYVLTRITISGALFLGTIAIFPNIAKAITGINTLLLGGTGVLIVVSVVLETIKALEANLVMRNYEGFL